MDELGNEDFWEIIENEYGVEDDIDMFSEQIVQVISPRPGFIILITNEADQYGKWQE